MQFNSIIYPTSADPSTLGHADILCRAADKFDLVYWVIGNNPQKNATFSVEQRLLMMDLYIKKLELKNVIFDYFEGATIRYALAKGAKFLLRGLRNTTDFQLEIETANANHNIDSNIETISIFSDAKYSNVSSSMVKQLAWLNEDFSKYVIPEVVPIIKQAYGHSI